MPPPTNRTDTYAAVDLGSNSFHLLIARKSHGELRVLDRIREMVRLAEGLDSSGRLAPAVRERALACLARFGQRLRRIPSSNVRAVGTQTFRKLHKNSTFLHKAETALGFPIEIIGGREEARLVYLGVYQGVAGTEERRLVVDIGGGSTELVIGQALTPLETESMQFGCVSVTRRFFGQGRLSQRRWDSARHAVLAELQELQGRYRQTGWTRAIGSSGTIRAVADICAASGWCERNITIPALQKLEQTILEFPSTAAVSLPGLSEQRQPVIAGGVALLSACFEALDLQEMVPSPFALREGVLSDLLGRQEHKDPRDLTVEAFMSRYNVDRLQAQRVRATAEKAFDQLATALKLNPVHRKILGWAADLHETGLSISHSQYQVHSGYLVAESDMAGFSLQEQAFLARLVNYHRRKIEPHFSEGLPERLRAPLRSLIFILRFAWVLCRTRDNSAIPRFSLTARKSGIRVYFDQDWMEGHPLTVTDLEQERILLEPVQLTFGFGSV